MEIIKRGFKLFIVAIIFFIPFETANAETLDQVPQTGNILFKSVVLKHFLGNDDLIFDMDIGGEGAIVTEITTDQIMYMKNAFKRFYPASTTKIMTLLIAIENGNLEDVVTVCPEANQVPSDSSFAYINAGDQLTLRDLLYGLMIASGNDAAIAVSCHIAGDEQKFVEMMNEKVDELGLLDTHFANPHGYHDPGHYTTPYDLAQIMKAGAKYDEFRRIIGATQYETIIKNKDGVEIPKIWNCLNRVILKESEYYINGIIGSKTGFTSEAKHTLVSLAEKDGYEFVAVIFAGQAFQRYIDTKKLFYKAFETIEAKKGVLHYQNPNKLLETLGFTLTVRNLGIFPYILNNSDMIHRLKDGS